MPLAYTGRWDGKERDAGGVQRATWVVGAGLHLGGTLGRGGDGRDA